MNKVWPSGSAWAAKSAPVFPPAPVLFSTTMGWPHLAVSLSAAMRASTSLMPPPGNGMMNLTGLAENPDATCPRAGNTIAVKAINKPSAVTRGHMRCSELEMNRIRLRPRGAMECPFFSLPVFGEGRGGGQHCIPERPHPALPEDGEGKKRPHRGDAAAMRRARFHWSFEPDMVKLGALQQSREVPCRSANCYFPAL